MICLKCGWRPTLALGAGLLCAPLALAQGQDVTTAAQAPRVAGPGAAEGDTFKDAQAAYQNVFHLANSTYGAPTRLGYGSGQFNVGVPLGPGLNYGLPLVRWGFRPEDAEIKLGNFYLDVESLSGAVLFSDNANATQTNRKSGAISIVQLRFAMVWQLLENLHLAAAGAITWLPFKNEIGVRDPLSQFGIDYGLSLGPHGLFELSYDVPLGGWDVLASDQFFVQRGDTGVRENIDLLDQNPHEIADQIGRYSFRENLVQGAVNSHGLSDRAFARVTEYRNSLGLSASRVVPTETRVTLFARHDNSWYSGNSAGLPSSRDVLGVSLDSVRENMRFKPFLDYYASKYDTQQNWDHTVRGGLRGPVTENIDFLGDTGYTYIGDTGRESLLWKIRLEHNPRPSTVYSIQYSRFVTEPDRDLETSLLFRWDQGLGPYLTAGMAVERATFEDLDNNNSGGTEYRAEARLVYKVSPRTDLKFTVLYSSIDYKDPARADSEMWTGRIQLDHKYAETIYATLLYQYERRDSQAAGDSYYENLVILRVTKSF